MDGVARRLQLLKHGKNLQDVAMFGSLKPAVMRQLAMKMQDVSFAPGEVVVLQGDPGDSMYVVQEGSCTVDLSRSSAASARSSLEAPPDLLPGAVFRTGRQRIVDVDAYIRSAKFNHADSQTGYASLSYMNVTGRDWSHKRMKYFGKLSSLRSICGPHANANVRHPQCVL